MLLGGSLLFLLESQRALKGGSVCNGFDHLLSPFAQHNVYRKTCTPTGINRQQHIGSGTLGASERFPLAAGDYTLRLESDPPREFPLTIGVQESLALTLVREGERYFSRDARQPVTYFDCAPEGR